MPAIDDRQPARIDRTAHHPGQRRIEPAIGIAREGGTDRQPLTQHPPGGGGRFFQRIQMRPRRLRVHMVGGHRRYASPVVYARAQQRRHILGPVEVGRSLDAHLRPQDQPGNGDRPEMFLERGLGMIGHARAWLGPEVLDDHLLDMARRAVQVTDRDQRLDTLGAGLADADQQPGGERHASPPRRRDRRQPACRQLVRRAMVGSALCRQAIRGRLKHQPHRGGDRAERGIVRIVHQPRVEVRQQAGLRQHGFGHLAQIGQGGRMAQPGQRRPRSAVARLRPVPQSEQCLPASRCHPCACDRQHLVAR